jgi:hypothetical protein
VLRGTVLAAALGLAVPGCAPAELSPVGAKVAVVAAADVRCVRVAPVQASAGYNGRSGEANLAGVEAALRNEAALRGADTIVITSRQLGAAPVDPLARSSTMTSGGCPNCVTMTAHAYRCPGGSPTATAAAVTPQAAPAVTPQAAPAVTPQAAPAVPAADEFAAAVAAALAAARESARRCLPAGSAAATAQVRVTFAATGDVVYAEAEGDAFQGTPLGACVAQKLRNMHVPPWAGDPRSIQRALPLAP